MEEHRAEVGSVKMRGEGLCAAEERREEGGVVEMRGEEVGPVQMRGEKVHCVDKSAEGKENPDSKEHGGRADHLSLMISGVRVLHGDERRAVRNGDAGGDEGGEAGEEAGGEEKSNCSSVLSMLETTTPVPLLIKCTQMLVRRSRLIRQYVMKQVSSM